MTQLLRQFDLVLLGIIAGVAGALVVGDFLGVWSGATEQYTRYTLGLLSMVGLHLIISHFVQEDHRASIGSELARLNEAVDAAEVRIFEDSVELESYLARRMLEARKSVADLSWKRRISEGFSAPRRQVAHTYMDRCIEEASRRITYREVFIFNDPRRVEKLERRIEEGADGYSCRYFSNDSEIPRLQFVLVDEEEVFFFASSPDGVLCAIKNRTLCEVVRAYYDAVWAAARPLKDGPRVYEEELSTIRRQRNRSASVP